MLVLALTSYALCNLGTIKVTERRQDVQADSKAGLGLGLTNKGRMAIIATRPIKSLQRKKRINYVFNTSTATRPFGPQKRPQD